MSITARLTRLTPTLSARERVVLVIRARNAGQEPDPEVLRMPEEQRREYDELVCLCIAVNVELGTLIHIVQGCALAIQRSMYPIRVTLAAAELVESDAGIGPQPANRQWRKLPTVDSSTFFRGVAEEMRCWLLNETIQRWQELKAVEVVAAEIAAQFDGENPMSPELLEKARETEALLSSLVVELAGKDRKAPKPPKSYVAIARAHIDHALDYLGLRETR